MLKEGIKMTNNELKEELQKLSKESSVINRRNGWVSKRSKKSR